MSPAPAGERLERLQRAAFWVIPVLLAIRFHWLAVKTWFFGDDFAWLIHSTEIYSFRDVFGAIFAPMAQGTIRPWSDRIFFIVFYRLFGLDPLPFHIWVLVTQCANILLLLSVVRRLTGSRVAAFVAAVLWLVNTSHPVALAWTSAYNEPLCALFILAAFRFLLCYIETGDRRYWRWQWVTFLLGFGALELNVVYPALAATYTFLCARKHFVKTLPLFVPSVVFAIVHRLAAPPVSGAYVMHFGGRAMLDTLYTYWTWALGPGFLATMVPLQPWLVTVTILLLSLALLGMAFWRARKGDRLPPFCLAWFLILIAPMLPLSDHLTEYYTFLPSLGLAIAGGWALVLAWRQSFPWKALAIFVTLVYVGFSSVSAQRSLQWEYRRSQDVRKLVLGVERAHELHPQKMILLDNVDDELFWTGIIDHSFELLGAHYVYLTPGSEKQITPHPALGDLREFIIPPGLTWSALASENAVVYRVEPARLRNITTIYTKAVPAEWNSMKPSRIDLSNPAEDLLGPGWHRIEGNHRWMAQHAALQLVAPQRGGAKLHLVGASGPAATVVRVTVNGNSLPERKVASGTSFDLTWPLPDAVVGKPAAEIGIETDRTFTPPVDGRPLGLVFGVIEIVEP
jgi:hypothetical protein